MVEPGPLAGAEDIPIKIHLLSGCLSDSGFLVEKSGDTSQESHQGLSTLCEKSGAHSTRPDRKCEEQGSQIRGPSASPHVWSGPRWRPEACDKHGEGRATITRRKCRKPDMALSQRGKSEVEALSVRDVEAFDTHLGKPSTLYQVVIDAHITQRLATLERSADNHEAVEA